MSNATLYLTSSKQGGIWNGKPNTITNTSPLYKEASTGEELNQFAANNTTSGTSFTAIVVGVGGGIWKSTRDGDTHASWTKVFTAPTELYGCCYGGGHWVAVGLNNSVFVSTDATSWIAKKGAVPGAQWFNMAYGKGKFVAVGGVTIGTKKSGVVMYSTDGGNTWSKGNGSGGGFLQGIDYSPELNVFAAVGEGGTILSVEG
jgi:photosystem II stability/assembly factor-like uncharacterized protein